MSEKKYTWHKVTEHFVGSMGNIRIVEAGGVKFCTATFSGKVFAFARMCPHAGAPLDAGYIDRQGNVVCPLHGYRFNLQTGRESSGEEYFLRRWPVEIRTDGLYVGIEEGRF
jgi:nitrite reductase/ring-hydroxylating ferredoxin subunit